MKIQDQKLKNLFEKFRDNLESYHVLRGIDYNIAMMHKEIALSYQEKIEQYLKDKQE